MFERFKEPFKVTWLSCKGWNQICLVLKSDFIIKLLRETKLANGKGDLGGKRRYVGMGGTSSKYIMHDCRMPLWTSVPCTICNNQMHAKIYSSVDTNIAVPELCLSSSYSIHWGDWNECQCMSSLDRYFSLLENSSLLFYLESHNGRLGERSHERLSSSSLCKALKEPVAALGKPFMPSPHFLSFKWEMKDPNKSLSSSHSGREESLRPLRGYCWAHLLHKLITFFMKEEIHMECNQVTY